MLNESAYGDNNMSRKPTALDTFMARKAEIDEALARLQALSDDHFNAHPDEINWGDAGSLGYIAEKLKELTDFAFQEGEYTE